MGSVDQITQYRTNHTYAGKNQAEGVRETKGTTNAQLKELTAGKVFEGTVTEMKNGQVTIGLTNGQSITARMDGSVNLKPGEPMFFEVRSNNGTQISIRPVSAESAMNPTLNHALKAAGLTVNERNIAMVNAMMKEQMPIDKASLLNMLKVSMQYSDRDINSIVQMTKLNFEINEGSISQFENYKTNQHMLLDQFQDFMNAMPDVMKGSHAVPKEVLSFQQQLLNIFKQPGDENAVLNQQAEQVAPVTNEGQENLAVDIENPQTNGNAAQAEMAAGAAKDPSSMAEILKNLMSGESGETASLQQEAAVQHGEGAEAANEAAVKTETQQLLSPKEITDLTNQLKEFPGLSQDKTLFRDGSLNTNLSPQQLLEAIQQALENSQGFTSESLQKLFYGDSYQKVMKHVIEKQWTVSPQELEGEHKVEEFYDRLDRQLQQLDTLLQNTGKEGTALSKTVDSMRNNLDFMNQVNQMYNYIQIPLKLHNQNAHSDLYVYTNKKKLHDKDGELTALLHLDMEHLGSTDIYIKMKEKNVSATFYLADQSSFQLILGNGATLEKKLEEKGYNCTVSVENQKKEQDFVEDFLKKEKPPGKVHRYSFDVKT